MPIDFSLPEIQFACRAVSQASALAQQVRSDPGMHPITKNDRSPVTVGDFAGQALIGHLLSKSFPEDSLVAEECSDVLRTEALRPVLEKVTDYVRHFAKGTTPEEILNWIDRGGGKPSQRFWTLDPIDGTRGFLRGEQYVIALALIVEGQVQLGVLGCPHLTGEGKVCDQGEGSLYVAARGQGAWSSSLKEPFKFQPLKVSACKDPKQMRVLHSVEKSYMDDGTTEALMKGLATTQAPLAMDSQAKYAVLAAGAAELLFYLLPPAKPHYRMKIWDVAPGSIVVEEAGGRVSDLEGRPLDFGAGLTLAKNPGILVTNGHLHARVLQVLNQISQKQ